MAFVNQPEPELSELGLSFTASEVLAAQVLIGVNEVHILSIVGLGFNKVLVTGVSVGANGMALWRGSPKTHPFGTQAVIKTVCAFQLRACSSNCELGIVLKMSIPMSMIMTESIDCHIVSAEGKPQTIRRYDQSKSRNPHPQLTRQNPKRKF